MAGNSFGNIFRITTSGESYSGAFNKSDIPSELKGGLIVIADGVPAGIEFTKEMLEIEMAKRRPGKSVFDTPRKEKDKAFIFSGIMENNMTTGAPVGILIPNSDILESQMEKHRNMRTTVRPGQATYTYYKKYGRSFDYLGAGRASGRETAARVAGGAVAKAVLKRLGVEILAYVSSVHGVKTGYFTFEQVKQNYMKNEMNCPDNETAERMKNEALKAMDRKDSVGGTVDIIVRGIPAGLGEPVFDKLDAMFAHALLSIGAVKGIEFGAGFSHAEMYGSESNDTPVIDNEGRVSFLSNNAGGISGGISNGDEIRMRVVVKPTPTIAIEQNTVDLGTRTGDLSGSNVKALFSTRNDVCICPRVFGVCEAMTAIVILDAWYMAFGMENVKRLLSID